LQENTYIGGDEVLLRLNYNGVISWQPAFHAGFTCKVSLRFDFFLGSLSRTD
ncbi:hypothetical protein PoB_001810100, partial [Plakobranchus ocellatus]